MSAPGRGRSTGLFFLPLILVALACSGPLEPQGVLRLGREDDGRTVEARLDQEIEITLGTVGPGQYGTPSVSSAAVGFVNVAYGAPNPGGPIQVYRLHADAAGSATVTMIHSGGNPDFSVDIVVR